VSEIKQRRQARGWSQVQLACRLQEAAAREGRVLPDVRQLKSTISRWENGRARPDWQNQALLERVLGVPALGSEANEPPQQSFSLEATLQQARFGIDEALDTLRVQVELVRRLDGSLGARAALQQARALLTDASERLMYSVCSEDRRRTGALVADLASLVGWQSLDAGDGHEAWRSFEQAKAAAREAGDNALLAHAMGEQSIALLDVGRAGDAAALINDARSQVGLPPRLTAWLFAAQAEAFACAGDRISARRCLRSAERTLPAPGDEALTPYLRLDDANLARWRGHILTQLRDSAAGVELHGSLSSVRGKYGRAEAGLLVDLATVAFRNGDRESGARHIRDAQRVSTLTGSQRQMRRLAALRTAA
jgi:transcriptional regulator with XRE-family HTH domain